MRWNSLVKYELRVARDDVVLQFAYRCETMPNIELLGARIEGRNQQKDVAAITVKPFRKAEQLCADAATARFCCHREARDVWRCRKTVRRKQNEADRLLSFSRSRQEKLRTGTREGGTAPFEIAPQRDPRVARYHQVRTPFVVL